jgi:hypothetical protein
LIHVEFASGQVGGLNAGGAFIDGGDAGIAQVLAGAGFLDKPMPPWTCTPSEAISMPISVTSP